MFDAERRQVSVGREVPAGAQPVEEPEQDLPATLAGMQDGDVGLRQPGAHARAGLVRTKGMGQNLTVGGHADEPQDRHPRQADRLNAIEQPLPPGTRRPVHA